MRFVINGFPVEAGYPDAVTDGQLIPLLRKLTALYESEKRRIVVFLAGPPASGKSTLAAMLGHLSETVPWLARAQALPCDGYHYPEAHIASHTAVRGGKTIPMKRVKGAPDTFDTAALGAALDRARQGDSLWNAYSRVTHDVVPDAIRVTAPIVIVEGNWLLLDRPPWNVLGCDVSVFLSCDPALLRKRLIERKMRGGLTREAAEAFYAETDGPNAELCLLESRKADITIEL